MCNDDASAFIVTADRQEMYFSTSRIPPESLLKFCGTNLLTPVVSYVLVYRGVL